MIAPELQLTGPNSVVAPMTLLLLAISGPERFARFVDFFKGEKKGMTNNIN